MRRRNGHPDGIGYAGLFRYCCFARDGNRLFARSIDNQDLQASQQARVHVCTDEETQTLKRLVHGESTNINPRRDDAAIEEKRIEEIKLWDIFSCTVEVTFPA